MFQRPRSHAPHAHPHRTSIRLCRPASTTTSLLSSAREAACAHKQTGGSSVKCCAGCVSEPWPRATTVSYPPVISMKKKMPVMKQYSDAKTRSSENWGRRRARALHAVR